MNTEPIERAVELLGGQTAAAAAIGVSQPTVSNWMRGQHKVTPANAVAIERATGGAVRREELCPDIFRAA